MICKFHTSACKMLLRNVFQSSGKPMMYVDSYISIVHDNNCTLSKICYTRNNKLCCVL